MWKLKTTVIPVILEAPGIIKKKKLITMNRLLEMLDSRDRESCT